MKIRKVWDMAVIPMFVVAIALFSTSVVADQGDRNYEHRDDCRIPA